MESGIFHTTYQQDLTLRRTPAQKVRLGLFIAFVLIFPFFADNYYLTIANQIAIAAVGAVGLNILVGFTGQISLGQGAFMAVGAYTASFLTLRLGLPFWLTIPLAASVTARDAQTLRAMNDELTVRVGTVLIEFLTPTQVEEHEEQEASAAGADEWVRTELRHREAIVWDVLDAMVAEGLALGGTPGVNAVVFDGDRVVSPGGLRRADEPVRHKMLDALGDLALAGAPLLGSFRSVRGGHRLNARVLQALFADAEAWTTVRAPWVRDMVPAEVAVGLPAVNFAADRS